MVKVPWEGEGERRLGIGFEILGQMSKTKEKVHYRCEFLNSIILYFRNKI